VEADPARYEEVQSAALILELNRQLSHEPNRPTGMDDGIFVKGFKAAGSSNLCMGVYLPDSVWLYMDDSGSELSEVGHRRWILNPTMGKTAFGHVGSYSAMYAFDTSNTTAPLKEYAAWPNGVFPVNLLNGYLSWSVSVPEAFISNPEAVSAEITRERGGKHWTLSKNSDKTNGAGFNISSGYGYRPAIIFRPDYLNKEYLSDPLYTAEDVFRVKISGLTQALEYTVKLFDLDSKELIANTQPKG
jgi:hypothetical protein